MRGYSRETVRWFYLVIVIVISASVLYVVLGLRQPPPKPRPLPLVHEYSNNQLTPESGYESFYFENQGFGLVFSNHQAPFVAEPLTNLDVLARYATRDFVVSILDPRGLTYKPFDTNEVVCVYDGALHLFTGDGCSLAAKTVEGVNVYEGQFIRGDLTRFSLLAPIKFDEFMLVVTADYQADCGSRRAVCEARLIQVKEGADKFLAQLVQQNHNLFTQDLLVE